MITQPKGHIGMRKFLFPTLIAATIAATSTTAFAQTPEEASKARTDLFRAVSAQMKALGAMAKGDYDAQAAKTEAGKLLDLASTDMSALMIDGSDSDALPKSSRLKPEALANADDFLAKYDDFYNAVVAMNAVAGDGAAALGGSLGPIGGTCKACHDDYRGPRP